MSNSNLKKIKGQLRQQHFKNKGTVAEWRGQHVIHNNKVDKRSNRRIKKQQAINEQME